MIQSNIQDVTFPYYPFVFQPFTSHIPLSFLYIIKEHTPINAQHHTSTAQPSGIGGGASAEALSGAVRGVCPKREAQVFAPSVPDSVGVAP